MGWKSSIKSTVAFCKSLYFYSHKKCHSLPGIFGKVHIKEKFQKTEFYKYVTNGINVLIITSI